MSSLAYLIEELTALAKELGPNTAVRLAQRPGGAVGGDPPVEYHLAEILVARDVSCVAFDDTATVVYFCEGHARGPLSPAVADQLTDY